MAFALKTQPTESRQVRIIALHRRLGAVSLADVTHAALAEGIFSVEELEELQFQACKHVVNRALRERDAFGLPVAGRTGEQNAQGDELWQQRELWGYAAYEVNIVQRTEQGYGNLDEAYALQAECQRRLGKAPLIQSYDEWRQTRLAEQAAD